MTLPTLSFAKSGEGNAGERGGVADQEEQRARPLVGKTQGKVAKAARGGKK